MKRFYLISFLFDKSPCLSEERLRRFFSPFLLAQKRQKKGARLYYPQMAGGAPDVSGQALI